MTKKNPVSNEAREAAERAANRLHHLSLRYVGALIELGSGKPVGLVPVNHPGRTEGRDLIDLILLCRAEINGVTRCLIDAGLLDAEKVSKQFAEEYEWLAQQKAEFLGCEIHELGLTFKKPGGAEGNRS